MKRVLVAALLGLACFAESPNANARPRTRTVKRAPAKKPSRWVCPNTSGTRSTMTDCERDHALDVFHGEFGGVRRNPGVYPGGLTWNQIQALKQSLRDQSASSRSRASGRGHY